jgi:hypothetical protein
MGDIQLKVGGNEKQGGPGREQLLGYVLRLWRSRVICHLNNTCSFGLKFLLLFPLVAARERELERAETDFNGKRHVQ